MSNGYWRGGSSREWKVYIYQSDNWSGMMIPEEILMRRDRIGPGDMRHRLILAIGKDHDLPDRQPPAELQEPAFRDQVARGGLAQKVDVEVGRDGERHGTDRREHRHVERHVGERHHGRAGNGAARPDLVL